MLSGVEWGEYRIGDLFEVKGTLSFNKEALVSGDEYDYVTRTSQNQGILQTTAFVNKENLNEAGTWSLGLLQMDFFYRQRQWYAGQFVRKVVFKGSLPNGSISFFTTVLNALKPKLLSVLVRDVNKTFLDSYIQLPTRDGKIDFMFMERFVAELKAQRVAELKAYLAVTGLSDYTLTPEEQQAIQHFREGNLQWRDYRIAELFEVLSYKKRFDANKVTLHSSGHPYIVRTSANNGCKGYLQEDEAYLNEGNTLSFGQDTATVFYQKRPYFTGDKIKILKCKDRRFKKEIALFFTATIDRAFSSFSWGSTSFSEKAIKDQQLSLPIANIKIDYNYMETFIRAIEKLVIRDVVLYADRELAATEQVINQ